MISSSHDVHRQSEDAAARCSKIDNGAGKARFGWRGGDKSRKIPRRIAAELELCFFAAGDAGHELRFQTSSGVISVTGGNR